MMFGGCVAFLNNIFVDFSLIGSVNNLLNVEKINRPQKACFLLAFLYN
jgi:hypothetical protein